MMTFRIKDFPLKLLLDPRIGFFFYKLHNIFKEDPNYSPYALIDSIRCILENEKVVFFDGKYVLTSFLPPIPSKAFLQMVRATPDEKFCYSNNVNVKRSAPNTFHISVTDRCNYNCFYCSNPGAKKELSTDRLLSVINELQDMGVAKIGFTGGEPLMRQDILDLVSEVDERSVSILHTNGFLLNQEMAVNLKQAGLFAASVSLDHYDKEECDRRSGYEGSFEMACNALKNARNARLYTIMQTVVTRDMADHDSLLKMVELAKDCNAHEIRFLDLYPAGRMLQMKDEIMKREDIARVIWFQKEVNKKKGYPKVSSLSYAESKRKYGCGAGANHSYMDCKGNVYPCDFVPVSFGNIQEKPLRELWERMHAKMGASRCECFLRQNAMKLRGRKYPIADEEVEHFLQKKNHELPEFYKRLGGERR